MSAAPKDNLKRVKRAAGTSLLRWFSRHQRDLPWRRNRTAYRVWVSELMLQQTRADQALPYYTSFMKRFPSLRALAEAPRADVLKQWEGLGYYARARRAHETAKFLTKHKAGRFPRTYDALLELPGVGPYTAAAIASFCFGEDVAVLDGNVIRVLSRLLAYDNDVTSTSAKKDLLAWAHAILPRGRSAEFNEAVMELGALICSPRKPSCETCPMRRVCSAYEGGDPTPYPVKKKRGRVPHKIVGAGVVVNSRGQVLIAQRRDGDMLGGLWEFPGGKLEKGETMAACIARELDEELGIRTKVGERLTVVDHAFSHFTMELHAHWARIIKGRPKKIGCEDYAWVSVKEMRSYPFPRADIKIIEVLEESGVKRNP